MVSIAASSRTFLYLSDFRQRYMGTPCNCHARLRYVSTCGSGVNLFGMFLFDDDIQQTDARGAFFN